MTTHVDLEAGYLAMGFNDDMDDNDMWAYHHDTSGDERSGYVRDLFSSDHNEPPEDD